MKRLAMIVFGLVSASAFAGSYDCKITVTKDGETVGTMSIQQAQVGMSASSALYTLPISKKKNIFGKTVKETAIVLSGLIQADTSESECSLQGKIQQEVTTIRRTIETDRQPIAEVDGVGAFTIDGSGSGYSVQGSCSLNP